MQRFAHSYAGVVSLERELEVPPQWANSLSGLRHVAGRLPLAEPVYELTPHFWQQNVVSGVGPNVEIEVVSPSGKPVRRDWVFAHMSDFWWLRSGPFAAMARYEHLAYPGFQVFLPIMWCGQYHTAQRIRGLRDQLLRLLAMPAGLFEPGYILYGQWRPGCSSSCRTP